MQYSDWTSNKAEYVLMRWNLWYTQKKKMSHFWSTVTNVNRASAAMVFTQLDWRQTPMQVSMHACDLHGTSSSK